MKAIKPLNICWEFWVNVTLNIKKLQGLVVLEMEFIHWTAFNFFPRFLFTNEYVFVKKLFYRQELRSEPPKCILIDLHCEIWIIAVCDYHKLCLEIFFMLFLFLIKYAKLFEPWQGLNLHVAIVPYLVVAKGLYVQMIVKIPSVGDWHLIPLYSEVLFPVPEE